MLETLKTAIIEITGMELSILAAGPFFKFNESVSFVINCKDQAEVDYWIEGLELLKQIEVADENIPRILQLYVPVVVRYLGNIECFC